MSIELASLRKEYTQASLTIDTVAESPFDQFRKWFEEAQKSELTEPNAMVLSTSSPDLSITQRTVLLKAFDEKGFVFYTNYKSRKAQQMDQNPRVCILFPWYQLERQVTVTGIAEKVSTAESMKYFMSRPVGSRLGAWVSHQSQVITSRSILEQKLHEMKEKFKDGKIPLPDFWGGYRIQPTSFEFWQGRPSRLHDRIIYTAQNNLWNKKRLAP